MTRNSPNFSIPDIDEYKDKLTPKQWEYINTSLYHPYMTKEDIAHEIGVAASTIYGWNTKAPVVAEALNAAYTEIRNIGVRRRAHSLLAAVNTLVDLLNSDDDNVRLRAAKEIIEGELGKAVSRNEISNAGDSELTIKVVYEDALGSGD